MRALTLAACAIALALAIGTSAGTSQAAPTTCDQDLGIANFCSTNYPGQRLYITILPLTDAGGVDISCSCGFATEPCDPTNSGAGGLPDCVPPNDTVGGAPYSAVVTQGTASSPGLVCYSGAHNSSATSGKEFCLQTVPPSP